MLNEIRTFGLNSVISKILKRHGKKTEFQWVRQLNDEKYELLVKDEHANVDRIRESVELAVKEPFTVNESRDDLLSVLARQVYINVKRGADLGLQVRQVAGILHADCYLVSKRGCGKELTLESLETTLYTLVRKLSGN